MKIKEFRKRFPEYGDLTDSELAQVASTMLSDLMDEDYNEAQLVNAPDITDAIKEVCSEIESAHATLKAMCGHVRAMSSKKDKEEKDLTPHFMALGMQLSSIEAAIKATQTKVTPEPIKTPEAKVCTSFKIKRDELGNIDSVIPKYEEV